MKEKKSSLLHTHISVHTEEKFFPYLEKYKVRNADSDLVCAHKRYMDDALAMCKSFKKSFWTIYAPCLIIGILLFVIGAILLAEVRSLVSISVFACGILLFNLSLIFYVKYNRKVKGSEEYIGKLNKIQSIRDSIDFNLGAPMDVNTIDVIYPQTKIKKNGKKSFFTYQNTFGFRIFKRDGGVCIIGGNSLYTLKGCAIKSFKINPKQVSFNEWSKKESYTSPKYKPYKIGYYPKTNTYFIRNTGELCLTVDKEDYYITIFPWSVADLEQILGITATPPNTD